MTVGSSSALTFAAMYALAAGRWRDGLAADRREHHAVQRERRLCTSARSSPALPEPGEAAEHLVHVGADPRRR
jgi:hypothetical protein